MNRSLPVTKYGTPDMIADLLPNGVVAVEAYEDVLGEPVFPGEADLVENAVLSRRREFVTTRRCAREALAILGHTPRPIRQGPDRCPLWPDGVVGSITHTVGYRAAAVAPRTLLASVGIDAEPRAPMPSGVTEAVTVPGELEMLAALDASVPGKHWERLLFSAKESVYKAWYPLTGRWLDFGDARLTIDPTGLFTAQLLVDGSRADAGPPLCTLQGRFAITSDLILTAVTVPR